MDFQMLLLVLDSAVRLCTPLLIAALALIAIVAIPAIRSKREEAFQES